MNLEVIIGATAIIVGIASLVVALVLRNSSRAEPIKVLRYFFLAGIRDVVPLFSRGFRDYIHRVTGRK